VNEPLWATGPGEILRHGIKLLANDSDSNRRLAMIAIDNSVELMLKTYISIPKRVTGLQIPRRERDEICSSFPQLLDGIEMHAAEKIMGIDLGEIEWFHRLRNELYHQGNGLTVERHKVEVYAELAKVLFENLFGVPMKLDETSDQLALGEFITAWVEIEKELSVANTDKKSFPTSKIISQLLKEGRITKAQHDEFREIQKIRNEVVHGVVEPKDILNDVNPKRMKIIGEFIEEAMRGLVQSLI